MKTLLMLAALTLATSASALSISTPVLDVKATTEACPWVVVNSWFRRMFSFTFPAINS